MRTADHSLKTAKALASQFRSALATARKKKAADPRARRFLESRVFCLYRFASYFPVQNTGD